MKNKKEKKITIIQTLFNFARIFLQTYSLFSDSSCSKVTRRGYAIDDGIFGGVAVFAAGRSACLTASSFDFETT